MSSRVLTATPLLLACSLLSVVACDEGGTSGGGGGRDSGGSGFDSGVPGVDGATPGFDGAFPGADGGFPASDGAVPGIDLGTVDGMVVVPGEDGGVPPGSDAMAGPSTPVDLALGRYDGCNMLPDGTRRCIGFSFARMADGTVRSWGGNTSGELADGTTTSHNSPAPVPALTGVTSIAPGNQHVCARDPAGGVSCWGDGAFGQLGLGTTDAHSTPSAVGGLAGVGTLVSGGYHSCALGTDGTVRCWGMAQFGQLGAAGSATCMGAFSCATSPVVVSVPGAVELALGNAHSCARTGTGELHCWGVSQFGQVGSFEPGDSCDDPGRGALACARAPRMVTGLSGVMGVTLGDAHTCALLAGGTVSCFGNGRLGQLGDGAVTSHPEPADVGLTGVTQISAGSSHTCALMGDGTVQCWGAGYLGQLGHMPGSRCSVPMGDFLCEPRPAPVPGITGAIRVIAGGAHTCSLHSDGTVRCWGFNESGQIGDGTSIGRGEPVVVPL